jgi:signal transduction histidine kinase
LILPLIGFVSFRKLIFLAGQPEFIPAAILLGAFTLLYLSEPALTRRYCRYYSVYLLLQMIIVEALGLLQPYEDTWGLLYIILGIQLHYLPTIRQAATWAAVFTTALLVTMIATLGLLPGLGFSLLTIALAVFLFSYDMLYDQAEAAKQESQKLLDELQAAHNRLKEYAAQAEELAAAQEHDRLINELHDSVSQMIFSISLTTESTRLLLAKDPARVPEALAHLQELTGRALAQMRALISQWRPG